MNKFMKKAHKGFTIIQLVIGMLIFAILTGIAFYGVSVYTAQANETRVDSDLSTFEVAIKDYMLNNVGKCSDGGLNAQSLNAYLTDENLIKKVDADGVTLKALVDAESDVTGIKSTLTDPWGHNYIVEIVNDTDKGGASADKDAKIGTDSAKIFVYTMGKDGKGAASDTKGDDSVLCVQYSDGEVFSRVYQPSDKKNGSLKANEFAFAGKMDKAIYAIEVK